MRTAQAPAATPGVGRMCVYWDSMHASKLITVYICNYKDSSCADNGVAHLVTFIHSFGSCASVV
jgi:hypothetical protein